MAQQPEKYIIGVDLGATQTTVCVVDKFSFKTKILPSHYIPSKTKSIEFLNENCKQFAKLVLDLQAVHTTLYYLIISCEDEAYAPYFTTIAEYLGINTLFVPSHVAVSMFYFNFKLNHPTKQNVAFFDVGHTHITQWCVSYENNVVTIDSVFKKSINETTTFETELEKLIIQKSDDTISLERNKFFTDSVKEAVQKVKNLFQSNAQWCDLCIDNDITMTQIKITETEFYEIYDKTVTESAVALIEDMNTRKLQGTCDCVITGRGAAPLGFQKIFKSNEYKLLLTCKNEPTVAAGCCFIGRIVTDLIDKDQNAIRIVKVEQKVDKERFTIYYKQNGIDQQMKFPSQSEMTRCGVLLLQHFECDGGILQVEDNVTGRSYKTSDVVQKCSNIEISMERDLYLRQGIKERSINNIGMDEWDVNDYIYFETANGFEIEYLVEDDPMFDIVEIVENVRNEMQEEEQEKKLRNVVLFLVSKYREKYGFKSLDKYNKNQKAIDNLNIIANEIGETNFSQFCTESSMPQEYFEILSGLEGVGKLLKMS
ncbi:hypothetical protein EIN_053350 [Entamoeba invadens IP1]|uniref:hypothetical protein n=1 Tax=Entamoeba invadens IP1 TaxID=370355 RepID=UPI0002C3E032|nr:hypothetical protein EIN_053350 [Entamoeba invadens IP1]ELP93090.1 hypothetical protein EIN_053350 [Entamoeba invadens IP1]|eukprot:XP_004259861.1 hypothetical protein EIN_053350 [Entamoeba invadens IP1]